MPVNKKIIITIKHIYGTLSLAQANEIEYKLFTNEGKDDKIQLTFISYEQAFNFWLEYNKL